MGRHKIDLTGQVINGIVIESIVDGSGGAGKHIRWNCICPICGKHFSVSCQHLNCKNPISMCGDCARRKFNDLSGQRFGKLTVLSRDWEAKTKRISYICECDCGSIVSVQDNHLSSHKTVSCGCARSSGEEQISQYLSEQKIKFKREKTFDGCMYVHPLRFDFYLPDYNLVIEYQGEQHYRPSKHFGGVQAFEIRQARDKVKREYCEKNNINYAEIKYDKDIVSALCNILSNEEIVCPYGNIVG